MSSSIPQLTPQGSGGGLVTLFEDTVTLQTTVSDLYNAIKDYEGQGKYLIFTRHNLESDSTTWLLSSTIVPVDTIIDWYENSNKEVMVSLPYATTSLQSRWQPTHTDIIQFQLNTNYFSATIYLQS